MLDNSQFTNIEQIMCYSVFMFDRENYMFFFFQAEDGIRDLVRSRGLGDVYKRQMWRWPPCSDQQRGEINFRQLIHFEEAQCCLTIMAVSYTHLTLPTSDLV